MRAAVLWASLLWAFSFAAHAEDLPRVEPVAVVRACAELVVLPEGRTAAPAAVTAYCQCAIDRAVATLTPAEFIIFGRVALSRRSLHFPPRCNCAALRGRVRVARESHAAAGEQDRGANQRAAQSHPGRRGADSISAGGHGLKPRNGRAGGAARWSRQPTGPVCGASGAMAGAVRRRASGHPPQGTNLRARRRCRR